MRDEPTWIDYALAWLLTLIICLSALLGVVQLARWLLGRNL